jgi:CDP-paratose 2-epimerase
MALGCVYNVNLCLVDIMEIVITGSSGLIGSEAVEYFARCGHSIHGIDNNMRADFFGPQGDTLWRLKQLRDRVEGFTHHNLDIRNRAAVLEFFSKRRVGAVAHCGSAIARSGEGSPVRRL